jgi:hypothetical protein
MRAGAGQSVGEADPSDGRMAAIDHGARELDSRERNVPPRTLTHAAMNLDDRPAA